MELIRKSEEDAKVFGLTVPLVTKIRRYKNSVKLKVERFGLIRKKTTPYEFYQFWINTDDRDVVKYLKYFTFLSHEEINELEKANARSARATCGTKKALGAEMTKLVHGEAALEQAIKISAALFSGSVAELTAEEIQQGFKDVPSYEHTGEEISLVDLLVASKIVFLQAPGT
ncbi:hypothetical protein GCM10020331_031480 [Ectobacillus funiculus]